MARVHVRLNLQTPGWATPPARLYPAALDVARWADEHGVEAIRIGEHHATDDGWCPSPIALASAVAAVTQRVRILLSAYLLPLHDPVHAAEDLAVLDLVSGGRLQVVLGAGYRQEEFDQFGTDRRGRGSALEEGVTVLRRAWTGEPFDYRGRRVRVTPRPATLGGPPLIMGGSSAAAARRAVRLGLDFFPTTAAAYEAYRNERARAGLAPPGPFTRAGPHLLHVVDDVERAWQDLVPHLLHEARTYAAWAGEKTLPGIDELRRGGRYALVSGPECRALIDELGPDGILTLHPLVCGLAPEEGLRSLDRFAAAVAAPGVSR